MLYAVIVSTPTDEWVEETFTGIEGRREALRALQRLRNYARYRDLDWKVRGERRDGRTSVGDQALPMDVA